MKLFFPPDFRPSVAWLADISLPTVLKLYQNIEEVIISEEDKEMLRSLEKNRLLFFTNHPSTAEPLIAFHVANLMGSRFKFMATRRAFDFFLGNLGKLYQSLGAFSIMPGVADKESMRTARNILAEPKGKLVLFPEGEPMCGENDNLMPLQAGIVKLSISALEDALKKDSSADITILPGFIKYTINAPMSTIIDDLHRSIHRIETRLKVDAGERNLLRRFLMIGRILLEKIETDYKIEIPPDADYNYRTGKARHTILDNVAKVMNLEGYNYSADAIHKLRHLTSIIELIEIRYPNPKLPKLSAKELVWANKECVKAYDMIVIKRDYLLSRPTPERFYEYLNRYESLVLGKTPHALGGEPSHLPRIAHVYFAKPFQLSEYYKQYKENKQAALESLLERLRNDMQRLLNNTTHLTRTIVEPFDVGDTSFHDFK